MDIAVERLVSLSDADLLAAYLAARRLYAERKFARDTEASRLEWQSARQFATVSGRVADRQNSVRASEVLAKKGQQIREMTRDLDLLKVDVDVLSISLRWRGVTPQHADDHKFIDAVTDAPQRQN